MKPKRIEKESVNDWPSLALLEFTVGLARAMRAKGNKITQAQLAKALGVSAPYVSSVMSGNENLTVEQMSRFAAALNCAIHIAVVEKDLRVRWIEDIIETNPAFQMDARQPALASSTSGARLQAALLSFDPRRLRRGSGPKFVSGASSTESNQQAVSYRG